jgi:glycosyltransferase 2 family protein
LSFLASRWFKVAVSLGLFVLLLRSTDLPVFRERVARAHLGWVCVAFLGYLLSQVLSAYKWQVLARPLGFVQPLRAFIAYYFAGMYFNLFAPSTVAGDLGRSALLAEGRERLGLAVQSVVADRISGFVMLLWVSAVGALFSRAASLPLLWRGSVIAAAVGATVGWWLLPLFLERFFYADNTIYRFLTRLVSPYHNAPGVLARACGLSFLFHLFQLALQVVVAHALSLEVSIWYLTVCIPLVNIMSGLPISFGGLGVREGGYVMFLALAGIDGEQALAFGLLWSAIVLGANVTGGLALLFSPATRAPLRGTKKTLAEEE